MAPTENVVGWQTNQIVKYLLDDIGDCSSRQFDLIEPDSGDDGFDPVLIADKLKAVADGLVDDVTFRATLNDLKKAVAQEAVDQAFSHGVDALCNNQVSKSAEVSSEMAVLKASVALGRYVVKECPDLKNKVQRAMNAFLNNWVTPQGGWNSVNL